ncbi:hypothetical protein PUR71_00820 [Streptomyces sp. SP17BM10]|uniref:hypothetical protein n=1 Tax=Streptomyces sp. SP17BM10 TaxID=3002530 RepID=UPI002E767675|nr:hypothetical protein [Streptomyces sp. SP17BM10]MEE1781490.1 hypothetical protein [Streptomyces sp. SP17BM10]
MRRDATAHPVARIRPLLRRLVPWPARRVLVALAAGLLWWLLVVPGQLADGAVLGLLAAGGWGLGLIPVHADRSATGPVRRRAGGAVGRAEAPTPPIG